MHIEKIITVADRIDKAPDDQFDMNQWIREPDSAWGVETLYPGDQIPELRCGTAGCIAGWTIFAFPEEAVKARDQLLADRYGTPEEDDGVDIDNVARVILGIPWSVAVPLFFGTWSAKDIRHINKADAVACLRHLAATGVLPEPPPHSEED
jgi:hypothetical protein